MDPRLDDRAVAVPLAAILAIGFLLVAAGIYQVEVVPAETAEAEYEHSADLRQSYAGLADAIDRSATRGTTESIELAHLGGEPLTDESTRIQIRNEPATVTATVSDGSVDGEPDADQVGPGDVWEYDVDEAGLSGSRLEVVVTGDEGVFRTEKPIG